MLQMSPTVAPNAPLLAEISDSDVSFTLFFVALSRPPWRIPRIMRPATHHLTIPWGNVSRRSRILLCRIHSYTLHHRVRVDLIQSELEMAELNFEQH
ncbi:hypothetical protein PO002_08480 [Cupriavidus necator]|uniref:hypothetical protein n=1 Tax=Cupriavidus necator TaxID=106590 RepID=UPI0039C1E8FC